MIRLYSRAEIDKIKASGSIISKVFKQLEDYIKPNITTKDIDKLVEDVICSMSAIPSFKNYNGFPAAACVSVNEEVVHGIPSNRVLRDGDIVSVDVGAFLDGFHGDAARTFAVGSISDEAKHLIEVTKQSFFEGMEFARVGNRLSDISHAIQKHVEKAGFGVVRDMFGHGIGRAIHEEPSVPNFGRPNRGPKLKAGMVIAVEPMVTYGDYHIRTLQDGWTTVTVDGKLSAHYENTIAITNNGVEILTI